MADIALDVADKVDVVESRRQLSGTALEAIEAGAPVRFDPTAGTFRNGNATTAAEGAVYGISLKSVQTGEALTALCEGILDGFALDAVPFATAIYVSNTDGRIADAAGTTAVLVGRVVPGTSNPVGSNPDKLLDVHLSPHAVTA